MAQANEQQPLLQQGSVVVHSSIDDTSEQDGVLLQDTHQQKKPQQPRKCLMLQRILR